MYKFESGTNSVRVSVQLKAKSLKGENLSLYE